MIKILLPVDGSPAALAAVQLALRAVGEGLRASFVLANVQEPASLYEVVLTHDADRLADLKRGAGADLLAPAEALLDAAGAEYESEVVAGDPHHALVDIAERYDCNAIMMGARGEGGPGPGALGSVALAVLTHSVLPVTVVHTPEPAEPAGDDSA